MKNKLVFYILLMVLFFTSCNGVQTEEPNITTRNNTNYSEQYTNVELTEEIISTNDTQGAYSKDTIIDDEIQTLLRNSLFIRKVETVDNSEFVYDENIYIDWFSEVSNKEHRYYKVIEGDFIIHNNYSNLRDKIFKYDSDQRSFYTQYNDVILCVPEFDENHNMIYYTYIRPIKRDSEYVLTPDNYKIISNGGGKAEIELYYHQKQGDELIPLTATVRFVYTDDMYAKDTWQIEYEDYLM